MHARDFVFTGLLTLHCVVKTSASSIQCMGCCPTTMMGVTHNYRYISKKWIVQFLGSPYQRNHGTNVDRRPHRSWNGECNNIQMNVYRCTLYTTLQNPSWKRKTGSSQSDSDTHLMQQFKQEKRARCCPRCARGVLPRLADIYDKYIYFKRCCPGSAKEVLPLLQIYVSIYIYLVSILVN
jgi:hypothetical protein